MLVLVFHFSCTIFRNAATADSDLLKVKKVIIDKELDIYIQNQNGKYLKLQIDIIHREHRVNQVSMSFPKGDHSSSAREIMSDTISLTPLSPLLRATMLSKRI